MKIDFLGSCAKELANPESNEDQAAFSKDGLKFALCDGASESYDPRLWANQLASRFVNEPSVGPEWLECVVQSFAAAHDFSSMSWSKQMAFERGSFSTLLGIRHDSVSDEIHLVAIGDCVALLLDHERLIDAWPIADPERFKDRPTLLATIPRHNFFVSDPAFVARSTKTWRLSEHHSPRVLCMSDALAEWALRQGMDGMTKLAAMKSPDELFDLVIAEREAKRLRVDDSTLAVLSFSSIGADDALPLA